MAQDNTAMRLTTLFSAPRIAGALLSLSLVLTLAGAHLYGKQVGYSDPGFRLERSLFLSAVIATALGFVILETVFRDSPARVTAHIGTMTYFFGAVLLVVAECLYMQDGVSEHPLLVTYVVLALLGEAVIGVALLQSNLLPAWLGWTSVVWTLGGLIILLGFTWRGSYIPLFQHVMPLLIGIPLLWRGE